MTSIPAVCAIASSTMVAGNAERPGAYSVTRSSLAVTFLIAASDRPRSRCVIRSTRTYRIRLLGSLADVVAEVAAVDRVAPETFEVRSVGDGQRHQPPRVARVEREPRVEVREAEGHRLEKLALPGRTRGQVEVTRRAQARATATGEERLALEQLRNGRGIGGRQVERPSDRPRRVECPGDCVDDEVQRRQVEAGRGFCGKRMDVPARHHPDQGIDDVEFARTS